MARRASSAVHPFWIVTSGILVIAALAAVYFVLGRAADPYRTIAPLDIGAYLENSNSLRGNTYKVTGLVWNSLAWSAEKGRLFSVEVDTDTQSEMVPVLIPAAFNHVNIQKGQKFIFKIEIDEKGILKVQDLRKA